MPDQASTEPKRLLKERDPDARRVYPLSRLKLEFADGTSQTIIPTPEQVAVAIAKCSRSDTPFDQNVLDVSLEKAAEFHEKWVVGYGHGSVAEHAVASVALENVSQIIIKILEDGRLASYTEKSSRYVIFTRNRVFLPLPLRTGPLGTTVSEFFDRLYGLYDHIQERVKPLMLERFPQPKEMGPKPYAAITKARVCDVARACLPAAATGKLGMTCGARQWALTITKLASSPQEEAQALAKELLHHLRSAEDELPDEALRNRLFPTLLKYAEHNDYMATLPNQLKELGKEVLKNVDIEAAGPQATMEKPVVIVRDDEYAEARIATALLAKHSRLPLAAIQKKLMREPETVERVIRQAVANRGDHDQLPREFEHAVFQHEIVMDYGAWRDVQRHRMCTQLNQSLGVDLGYIISEEVETVGLADEYRRIMDEASSLYRELCRAGYETEAEYIVPMAYRRRLIMTWNVRELCHFITLRSGKKGHPSYRKIAQETWRSLEATHPLIAEIISVDLSGGEEGQSTLGAKPKGF
jgi:thymidylate synthase ThyX